ncbi:MAG: 2,3-bisphosphoglycerate-independent phosphoglycerate mutase, partial [Rhodothermales bacterium]
MTTYKGIMIILDGLGDRPVAAFDGRTPLEAAQTPVMDRLAASGLCGLVSPLTEWVPAETQTGTGMLFGLARKDLKRLTRGPVEAAGVGLSLRDGDLALRCNFATLRPNGTTFDILDRRAGRIAEDTDVLCKVLDGMDLGDGITGRLCPGTEHRAVLVLSGPPLSDAVTNTDPGAGRKTDGVQPCRERTPGDALAAQTAEAVNTFVRHSYRRLHDHPVNRRREARGLLPANGLITRGAGKVAMLRNLVVHLGLKAALVAGEETIKGLARLFGFHVIDHPEFTGTRHTDVAAKVTAARHALDDHDLVFLHVKATDTYAHDLDPVGKKEMIERIDGALASLLAPDLVIGITGDHATDSTLGIHTGDPVPACLAAPHSRTDAVTAFSEQACMHGGLGHLS